MRIIIDIDKEISVDDSWVNSEQTKIFNEDMLLTKTALWREYNEKEEMFTRPGSKRKMRKANHKVKK